MLLSIVNRKVVYRQIVGRIVDIRGLHIPGGIVEDDVRGLYADMGFRLIL